MCPDNGVFTGIKYGAGGLLDWVQFICTSPNGETLIGPFGGSGGSVGEDRCSPGQIIGSIFGQSGSAIDGLGIRCVKYGETVETPQRGVHGGNGGGPFDDLSYSANYQRPLEVLITGGYYVYSIQVKYGNLCA